MRGILQGLAAADVEKVFRLHAAILNENAACQGMRVVAFDGKTLRGSFDKFIETVKSFLCRRRGARRFKGKRRFGKKVVEFSGDEALKASDDVLL